ncbi:hypothetical protein L249_5582 [Ophiocordyceps polyrhachis-furcata BCC 54312]|uniref:Major facilitator superfamily (MFS) profile domain-containing protein n=1 Tax=Ophiocordyceps polyrhachis-furcata BCC 54312 TaxID=1330021 RepID=A0A367LG45_9HYPO|nr:hypothetical protein L249_5582 [Ophiocordyceps polyrhachis-furcata BCC 54312]
MAQPGERTLVRKIDFFILSFCCLSYFVNYLDRSNLANAYVSGMREDLGFVGDQLNQINTCFTVGYILGQVPSNLSLSYIRPRFWFPSMMLLWGALTMATAATHSPKAIMAIRLFQGACEASTFVGTHLILGAWYKRHELGIRSGIFTASGLAGTMIGGFVQTGIHARLDGRRGLAGWRWLFIVDGLLTLPVAAYGFVLFPDTPRDTTAPYLSPDERALARARMPDVPDTKQRTLLTMAFARRVLTSWQFWGFVGLWVLAGEAESPAANSLLALFMQSHPSRRYSVAQMNNYPAGVSAVGIVSTLACAALTDRLGGRRQLAGYVAAAAGIVSAVMVLTAARLPPAGPAMTAVVFIGYYVSGAVYATQAVFFAWCNDTMRDEADAFRGVVLAAMNLGSNAVNAWWSILFYGASMAPWFTVGLLSFSPFPFHRGMWTMLACCIALALWTAGLARKIGQEEKRRAKETAPSPMDIQQSVESIQTYSLSEGKDR